MKTSKKLLALLLAVVLVFSAAVPAFADGEEVTLERKYPYEKLFNIGDSIARGRGLDTSEGERQFYGNDVWCIENSMPDAYPALVAAGTDAELIGNLQYMGMRSVEAYYALGGNVDPRAVDDYNDIPEDGFGYRLDGAGYNNPGCIALNRERFQDWAGEADLILLELGLNDVLYSSQVRAGLLSEDALTLENVEKLISCIREGYNNFRVYYPLVLDRILELQTEAKGSADDVTLALVGIYNPFANCPITEDIYLPLGEVLTSVSYMVNQFIKECAAQHRQCVYVDITATETPISTAGSGLIELLSDNATLATHPTREGYAYIARQILNAVPYENVTVYPKTFVQLNLNTDFKVTHVYLGTKEAHFTQNGYSLVVENYSRLQNSMTVIGQDSNGNTLAFVYSLNYSNSNGYTTYRITSSNNVAKAVSRIVTGTISVINKLSSAICSIFNK